MSIYEIAVRHDGEEIPGSKKKVLNNQEYTFTGQLRISKDAVYHGPLRGRIIQPAALWVTHQEVSKIGTERREPKERPLLLSGEEINIYRISREEQKGKKKKIIIYKWEPD